MRQFSEVYGVQGSGSCCMNAYQMRTLYFAYLLAILVWLSMQYIYVFPLHTSPLTYSRAWGNPLKEESSFSSSFSSRSLHKFTVLLQNLYNHPPSAHTPCSAHSVTHKITLSYIDLKVLKCRFFQHPSSPSSRTFSFQLPRRPGYYTM